MIDPKQKAGAVATLTMDITAVLMSLGLPATDAEAVATKVIEEADAKADAAKADAAKAVPA
jgi:hypothetical protein